MEIKDNKGMGDRLSELIKVYGLSVNALAAEIGGTTAKYYKLINGKSKPDFDTIYSVLNKFPDISAEWFMRGEGPMKKSDLVSKEEAELLHTEIRLVQKMYRAELVGKPKGATTAQGGNFDSSHIGMIGNNWVIYSAEGSAQGQFRAIS